MFNLSSDCQLAWQLQVSEFRKKYRNQSTTLRSDTYKKKVKDKFYKIGNQPTDFYLKETPADGNCFFHAVNKPGFNREALIKALLENRNNPEVLSVFGLEIRQFLYIACTDSGHETKSDQIAAQKMLKEANETQHLFENLDATERLLQATTAKVRVKLGMNATQGKMSKELLGMLKKNQFGYHT